MTPQIPSPFTFTKIPNETHPNYLKWQKKKCTFEFFSTIRFYIFQVCHSQTLNSCIWGGTEIQLPWPKSCSQGHVTVLDILSWLKPLGVWSRTRRWRRIGITSVAFLTHKLVLKLRPHIYSTYIIHLTVLPIIKSKLHLLFARTFPNDRTRGIPPRI